MTDSQQSKIPALFKEAHNRISLRVRGLLSDFGLSEAQWRLLNFIAKTPQIDFEQLKNYANTAADNLIPILNTLVKAGLIKLEPNPHDNSRQTIKLTTRGYFILQRINPKAAFLYKQIDSQRQSPPVQQAIKTITQLLGNDKKNY